VARAEMICPFSGKLCKECAIYRGRHYFLCFNKKYRGYLENAEELSEVNTTLNNASSNFIAGRIDLFHLSALENTKALDPFTVPSKDING
jgi:hypothetical protein